jgi:hypothetical protein
MPEIIFSNSEHHGTGAWLCLTWAMSDGFFSEAAIFAIEGSKWVRIRGWRKMTGVTEKNILRMRTGHVRYTNDKHGRVSSDWSGKKVSYPQLVLWHL